MYFRTYTCITELILVFQILYLYSITYSCISHLILVLQILYLYYGAYSYITELICILSVRKYLYVLQKFYLYKSNHRYYRTYTGTLYLILVQILFSNHFLFFSFRVSVSDFTYGYRIRHSRHIQLLNPVLFVIQEQCDLIFNIEISHITIEVDIHDRFSS